MAQSIFEQHEVLDQLFVELKRSYQLGKMPSLEQLQQIAPELSFDEYQILIERFSVYIHEQELQQFKAQVQQLKQQMPLLPDHTPLSTDILALEQEFMKSMGRFLINREQEIGKAATAKMQSLVQHNSELEAKIQELQNQQFELQHKLAQSQAQCQKLKEAYATQRRIMAQLSLSEEALGLLRAALANKNPKALPYLIKTKNTESSAYQEFTLLISLMPTITRENILKLVNAAMVLSQEAAEFSAKELLDFESELMSSPDDSALALTAAQPVSQPSASSSVSASAQLAPQEDNQAATLAVAAATATQAASAALAASPATVEAPVSETQGVSTEEQHLQSHLKLMGSSELTPEAFMQLHAALSHAQEGLADDEEGEPLDLETLMRSKPTVSSALSALQQQAAQAATIEDAEAAKACGIGVRTVTASASAPESMEQTPIGEDVSASAPVAIEPLAPEDQLTAPAPQSLEAFGQPLAAQPLATQPPAAQPLEAPQVLNPATTRISAMPQQLTSNEGESPAMSIARTLSTVDHRTTNIIKQNPAPAAAAPAVAPSMADLATAVATNVTATTATTTSPVAPITGSQISAEEEARAQKLFAGLEQICEQIFDDKEGTDITSLDLENAVSEAIDQELIEAQQAALCRRLVLKMMMLGREKMSTADLFAKDEDVVASLPSEEQKQFARAVLAWGSTKVYLKKGAVDEATTHSSTTTNVVVTVPPATANVPFNVSAAPSATSANTAITGIAASSTTGGAGFGAQHQAATTTTTATANANASAHVATAITTTENAELKQTLAEHGTLTLHDGMVTPVERHVTDNAPSVVLSDGSTRSLTIDLKTIDAQRRAEEAALGESNAAISSTTTVRPSALSTAASLKDMMSKDNDPDQDEHVEVINHVSRALPLDEGTLVREIAHDFHNDNIAAFAAASAKIESLVQKPAAAQSAIADANAETGSSTSSLAEGADSAVEGKLGLGADATSSEQSEAKAEIAAVAKDVLKVAQELEQSSVLSSDLGERKDSIFAAHDNRRLTGTTVLGLKENNASTSGLFAASKGGNPSKLFAADKQGAKDSNGQISALDDVIAGPNTQDDIDSFITGNISDPTSPLLGKGSIHVTPQSSEPVSIEPQSPESTEHTVFVTTPVSSVEAESKAQTEDKSSGKGEDSAGAPKGQDNEAENKQQQQENAARGFPTGALDGAAFEVSDAVKVINDVSASLEIAEHQDTSATSATPNLAQETLEEAVTPVTEKTVTVTMATTAAATDASDTAESVDTTASDAPEQADAAPIESATPVESAATVAAAQDTASESASIPEGTTAPEGCNAPEVASAPDVAADQESVHAPEATVAPEVTAVPEAEETAALESAETVAVATESTETASESVSAPVPEVDTAVTDDAAPVAPVESAATVVAAQDTASESENISASEVAAPEGEDSAAAETAPEVGSEVAASAPEGESTSVAEGVSAQAEKLSLLHDEHHQARLSLNNEERAQFTELTTQLAERFNNHISYLNKLLQGMSSGSSNQDDDDENTVWVADLDGNYQTMLDELVVQQGVSEKLAAALKEKMAEDIAREQATSISAEDFSRYPSVEAIEQAQAQAQAQAQNQEQEQQATAEPVSESVATATTDATTESEETEHTAQPQGALEEQPHEETATETQDDVTASEPKLSSSEQSPDANEAEALVDAATEPDSEPASDDESVTSKDETEAAESEESSDTDLSEDESPEPLHSTGAAIFTYISADNESTEITEDDVGAGAVDLDADDASETPEFKAVEDDSFNTIKVDFGVHHYDEESVEGEDDSGSDVEAEVTTTTNDSDNATAEAEPAPEAQAEQHSESDAGDVGSESQAETPQNPRQGEQVNDGQSGTVGRSDRFDDPAQTIGSNSELSLSAGQVSGSGSSWSSGSEVLPVNQTTELSPTSLLSSFSKFAALQDTPATAPVEPVAPRMSMSSVLNAFRAAALAPESSSSVTQGQSSIVWPRESHDESESSTADVEVEPEPENDLTSEQESASVTENAESTEQSESQKSEKDALATEQEPEDLESNTELESAPEQPELQEQEPAQEPETESEDAVTNDGDSGDSEVSSNESSGDWQNEEQNAYRSHLTNTDTTGFGNSQLSQGLSSAYGAPTSATFLFHKTQDVTAVRSMQGELEQPHGQEKEKLYALDNSTFNRINPYSQAQESDATMAGAGAPKTEPSVSGSETDGH